MKKLGIIGGMGPESTAAFYLKINQLAQQRGFPNRPACVVWNIPINLAVEDGIFFGSNSVEEYLPHFLNAAKDLEAAGCDFLAIPCNTVQVLAGALAKATTLPLVSIIDQTVARIRADSTSEVLILATSQTIKSRFYQDKLEQAGIGFVIPISDHQMKMDRIIHGIVNFKHGPDTHKQFEDILAHYDTKDVILGCTDLPLLKPEDGQRRYFDTSQILAEACVDLLAGESHEN
jgi:aspartate racemase